MPKKPKRAREQFTDRFVYWVTAMELLHWHFDLNLDETLDGEDANITIADDYHRALVKFDSKGWKDQWSDETLDRNILHELMHVHFEHLLDAATVARGTLHKGELELYEARVDHELEKAVDSIASAIIRSFGGYDEEA